MAPPSKFVAVDSAYSFDKLPHTMWCVSYEPIWQSLRLALSFKSLDETRESIARLEAYMGAAKEDKTQRLFRVRNLMCAVPIGQTNKIGIRHFGPEQTEQVAVYRDHISDSYKLMREVDPILLWDWHVVRLTTKIMVKRDIASPLAIFKNLTTERTYRQKYTKKPALTYFLTILKECLTT